MGKTLYIYRGLPGDGKTTFAEKMAHATSSQAVFAADDMKGLYINGQIQKHLQGAAHKWCETQVENSMKKAEDRIFVANTFVRKIYMQPYIKLAQRYGYSVHIIHSEAIIKENGDRTISIHDVPDDVVQMMRDDWEPFNPPKKKGISPAEIAAQIKKLEYPEVIVWDMDKTVKRPKDGRTFPNSPDDFEILPEFYKWAQIVEPTLKCYIASNQRGLQSNVKTVQFLQREVELLASEIKKMEVNLQSCYFAIDYQYWHYGSDSKNWYLNSSNERMTKPNTGMFKNVLMGNPDATVIWIVGDGHTPENSVDWEFAQNCQELRGRLNAVNVIYVPIELLNIYWGLLN